MHGTVKTPKKNLSALEIVYTTNQATYRLHVYTNVCYTQYLFMKKKYMCCVAVVYLFFFYIVVM